jgi:hypothetical protein
MAITSPPISATDFAMWRGATRARLLTFTTRTTPATAVNLTGCTIRAVFKVALGDSDANATLVYTNATDGGITVASDATLGLATLLILPTDTDKLNGYTAFTKTSGGLTYLDLFYAVRLIITDTNQDIEVYGTLTVWESAARRITP